MSFHSFGCYRFLIVSDNCCYFYFCCWSAKPVAGCLSGPWWYNKQTDKFSLISVFMVSNVMSFSTGSISAMNWYQSSLCVFCPLHCYILCAPPPHFCHKICYCMTVKNVICSGIVIFFLPSPQVYMVCQQEQANWKIWSTLMLHSLVFMQNRHM